MADRVGQQLGNYRLERLLGRGGFAEVYLGVHLRLGTQAAIKVLHTQLASDEEDVFQQEARTIARLEHPHIVRVLDFDVHEGTPFLVMSYAANGTLRTRHARGSQLALETIVPYVKQVADALTYAHEEKLVHRDIKPENMLVGRRDEVLLSDFGIATVAQSSRYQGTQDVAGTVAYMAPEQVQGKPRPASDQYSLGIVVYEWLTGTRPFHGGFTEIATQHVLTPPPPLREKLPTISPAIEQAVLIALAKDPKERFATVQAFANALEQAALLDQPTQYARPSMPLAPASPLPTPPVTPAQPPTVVVPQSRLPGASLTPPVMPSVSGSLKSDSGAGTLQSFLSHTEWVRSISWSPDGTRLVSGSYDGVARIWDVKTARTLLTYFRHKGDVRSVAWSPDGRAIASGSFDKTVHLWEPTRGETLFVYREHEGSVAAVAWAPDGVRIVSGSGEGTLLVWDTMRKKRLLTSTSHTQGICAVAWSPDGTRIASGSSDKTMRIWHLNERKERVYRRFIYNVYGVAWAPGGRWLASACEDKTVYIWDTMTEQASVTYPGSPDWVGGVAWSPDGRWIASSDDEGVVQVWEARTGATLYTYRGHSSSVTAVAWSPDGSRIASASRDKTVQVWQAPRLA